MTNIKFYEYDMRDDFEFQVYVSNELNHCDKNDSSSLLYIKPENITSGVISKKDDKIILQLATLLMKHGTKNKAIITNNDEVQNENDFTTIYATTWDGSIQFIIRKYFKTSGGIQVHSHNSVSYGETANYLISDMSISSQFMLSDDVYQVSYAIDYLHEWFSIYFPTMCKEQSKKSLIVFEELEFDDVKFKLVIDGNFKETNNSKKKIYFANSNITVKFEKAQKREFVFKLGIQLRNFFQLLLNKKIGLNKIILNRDNSWDGKILTPKDERENWFIAQSFLPALSQKKSMQFEIPYAKIGNNFEMILSNFLKSEKLQDFIERFLVVSQYKMPITPVLLTLSSAVESYLNGAIYSNGTEVKGFSKKLNMVFNGTWDEKDDTKDIIKNIKDNRDYYTHGVKPEKMLTETELIPIINRFIKVTRRYLLKEMRVIDKGEL